MYIILIIQEVNHLLNIYSYYIINMKLYTKTNFNTIISKLNTIHNECSFCRFHCIVFIFKQKKISNNIKQKAVLLIFNFAILAKYNNK